MTAIKINNLHIGYDSSLMSNVNQSIQTGSLTCLIGPNGSGKSTLIHTLCGLLKPVSGEIIIGDKPLNRLSPKETAKYISIVTSSNDSNSNLSIEELVALSRIPHSNWFGVLSEKDKMLIDRSINLVGLGDLKDRKLDQISDGELQRAFIAKALAQDTPFLFLDEPTAHLDISNRSSLIVLLKRLATKEHKAILLSTHELGLAIQLAKHIWLIDKKGTLHTGAPEDLILNGIISNTFDNDEVTFDETTGIFSPIISDSYFSVNVLGSGQRFKWTMHALKRIGLQTNQESTISITVHESHWEIREQIKSLDFYSIDELITYLQRPGRG